MSKIELERIQQLISDAKEFSPVNSDLESVIESGGPCVGAPCNPGPGGPPPKCPPRPRLES